MPKDVIDIDRGWKAIKRDLLAIAQNDYGVDVGIIGSNATETHEGEVENVFGKATIGFPAKKPTNAEVGTFHEFGTIAGGSARSGGVIIGTPERSFIRSTIDEKKALISRLFERVAKGIYDRRIAVKWGLNMIGLQAVTWIKRKIQKGIPPPLALSTIARKKSSKPLIDTGQLIGSLTYEVRKASEALH